MIPVLLSIALLLGGCGGITPKDDVSEALYEVGANLSGDPCVLVGRVAAQKIAEAGATQYNVQCGSWEQPSGSLFVVPAGSGSARESMSHGWWKIRKDQFLSCQGPRETAILSGVPALTMDCTMLSGGWPYLAIAAEIDGKIYLGDGIPNAFPPLERSIGVLSGKAAAVGSGGEGLSDEMRRLQSRLAGTGFDIRDVTQYHDLRRLARYHNARGEYAMAEKQYRKALTVAETERPAQEAFLSMHVALELSNQRNFEAAEAMFKRAERALPKSEAPEADRARLDAYWAMHLANQKKNDGAIAAAERATKVFQSAGFGPLGGSYDLTAGHEFTSQSGLTRGASGEGLISGEQTSVWGNSVKSTRVAAKVKMAEGRYEEAEAALQQARAIYLSDPEAPRLWAVELDVLAAEIAERQGQLGRAQRFLRSAVATEETLLGESRVGGLAYVSLGRVYAEQGNGWRALGAFRRGFEIIANQRGTLGIDDVLPYFRLGVKRMQGAAGGGGSVAAEMFEVAQRVTSPIVNQQIAQVTARLESGSAEVGELIRQIQDRQVQRDRIRKKLDLVQGEGGNRGQEEVLRRRWEELGTKVAELEREVQAASPRYPQLVLSEAISAEEVMTNLAADEALSLILIGSSGGVGFLVDLSGVSTYAIDLTRAEVDRQVARLRAPVEHPSEVPPYPVDTAYELYRALYGPVESKLSTKRHLINVYSGSLLSLPAAMLVTEPTARVEGWDYSKVPWLVSRHALTLAPAVQSFVSLRKTPRSQAPYAFLGFGDPIPSGDVSGLMAALDMPPTPTCRREAELIAHFSPLPDTATELMDSARALNMGSGNVVLGAAFTEATVKRKSLKDYRNLSFATHGLLPSKLQCLPDAALVTSARGGGDGLLFASEVAADLEMDADLVVLSACDTGGQGGGDTGGEALSGLARNFFYAGARNLLVSHWEVPSLMTMELVVRSFERLASGTQPAEALRASQLGIIASGAWSHPKAWAGFTLVGHGP